MKMVNLYFNFVHFNSNERIRIFRNKIMQLGKFTNIYFKITSCLVFLQLYNSTIYGQLFKGQFSGAYQGTQKNISYRIDAYKSDKKLKNSEYFSVLKEKGFTDLGNVSKGSKIVSAYYTDIKEIVTIPLNINYENIIGNHGSNNFAYFIDEDYLVIYLYISDLDAKVNPNYYNNHFVIGFDLNKDYAYDAGIGVIVNKNGYFDRTIDSYKIFRGKNYTEENNFISSLNNCGGLFELKIHLPTLFKERIPSNLININYAFPILKSNSTQPYGLNPLTGYLYERDNRLSSDINALFDERNYHYLLMGKGIEITLPKKYGDYNVPEEFLNKLVNTNFYKMKTDIINRIGSVMDKKLIASRMNFDWVEDTRPKYYSFLREHGNPNTKVRSDKNGYLYGFYIHYDANPLELQDVFIEMLNNKRISNMLLEEWWRVTYSYPRYFKINEIEEINKTQFGFTDVPPTSSELLNHIDETCGFRINVGNEIIKIQSQCKNYKLLNKENKVTTRSDFNISGPTVYLDNEKINFLADCSCNIEYFKEWHKFLLNFFNIGFNTNSNENQRMTLKEKKITMNLVSNQKIQTFSELLSKTFGSLLISSDMENSNNGFKKSGDCSIFKTDQGYTTVSVWNGGDALTGANVDNGTYFIEYKSKHRTKSSRDPFNDSSSEVLFSIDENELPLTVNISYSYKNKRNSCFVEIFNPGNYNIRF